jgi:DNA-binding SARP family transcriptional activator
MLSFHAMSGLELSLLGGFRLRSTAGPDLPVTRRKAQALLAYLALPAGRVHPRDKLAALLWPDTTDSQARQNLRQALAALRRGLGAAARALRTTDAVVVLDPDLLAVDVARFERLVAETRPAALEEAVVVYEGALLEGVAVDSPPFEEWLLAERERLRELALEALARLLAHHRQAGRLDAAMATALRLVALEPLHESVHRTLMRLYASDGRQDLALRQYQVCVDVLRRELGVEPEAETQRLYQDLLRQRPVAAADTSSPARAAPGLLSYVPVAATPLAGRAREMTRLREALDAARAGQGRAVAVLGEAGIGKSRLCAEITAEALARGVRALRGRCYESDRILAFAPWVDALRASRVSADAEALGRLGEPWRAELARLLPEVGPAPGGPGDAARLMDSLTRLFRTVAETGPVVVLVEDIHWADEMSLRFLAFLVRRVERDPVLVVATARDDEAGELPILRDVLHDLAHEERLVRLRLTPLSRGETDALVALYARETASLPRLAQQIWSASEGQPFMAVETLRALADSDRDPAPETPPLPERIRDVITGRLDRVGPAAGELVGAAAVIGREFDFGLVQRVAGLAERDVALGLEELVRRRILRGAGDRFVFVHDRIREIAYERLLRPRRTLLHRAAAAALEALGDHGREPQVAALGHHCFEGELWPQAAEHLRRAGELALARSAGREAVACFTRALDAAGRLEPGPGGMGAACDLHLALRTAHYMIGDFAGIADHLAEAQRLAEALGDPRRLGWVSARRGHLALVRGMPEEATELADRAEAIGEEIGDGRLVAQTRLYSGIARRNTGDWTRAEAALSAAIAFFDEHTNEARDTISYPQVDLRCVLAVLLAERGDFEPALAVGEAAVRFADDRGEPESIVHARLNLGRVRTRRGHFAEALQEMTVARRLCDERDPSPPYAQQVRVFAGHLRVVTGDVAGGLAEVAEASARVEPSGVALFRAVLLVLHAEALMLGGQRGEAADVAARARDFARSRGERPWQAHAGLVLGEIGARGGPGDADGAAAHYREALALGVALGMRPLIAHCHAGLGRLALAAGKARDAAEHLRAAVSIYREGAMLTWLPAAEAALAAARDG